MTSGADFTDKNLTGAEMKAAGLSFACRYLSGHPGGWKELSLAEAKDKTAHGILIVSNWEDTGTPANTVSAGESDAHRALAEHLACGGPSWRPIYFSIDHNVAVSGADHYFQGLVNVLGVGRVGCYGSAGLIQHLHGKGLIKWGWRTMSTGWYGGASTADCQIEQTGGSTVHGTSIDKDKALTADIGGWTVGMKPPATTPPPATPPSTGKPAYTHDLVLKTPQVYDAQAKAWQTQMKTNWKSRVVPDGYYGPYSVGVAKAFQKLKGLKVDGVVGPKTWKASFGE